MVTAIDLLTTGLGPTLRIQQPMNQSQQLLAVRHSSNTDENTESN
jgi:hypothetical protein